MEIGKYNVYFEGAAYDEKGCEYELVNIAEFNEDGTPANGGRCKSYYIRCANVRDAIRTEEDVRAILRHPNHAKLELQLKLAVKRI